MTQAQKVIKYFALAFAMILVVNIIGAILFGLASLGGVFGLMNSSDSVELKYTDEITNQISHLKIDLGVSSLTIETGDSFNVKYSDNVTVKQNGNELKIEDQGFHWVFSKPRIKVVLTIPRDYTFTDADIDTGVGTAFIADLNVRDLDLNIGVGKTTVENLTVTNFAEIDGGVGELSVLDSEIHKLDLSVGVGKTSLSTKISADSTIDAGVGELNLSLTDSLDNYSIYTEKGIGSIRLNGEQTSNENTYGSGFHKIRIHGGIGSIRITTN